MISLTHIQIIIYLSDTGWMNGISHAQSGLVYSCEEWVLGPQWRHE